MWEPGTWREEVIEQWGCLLSLYRKVSDIFRASLLGPLQNKVELREIVFWGE